MYICITKISHFCQTKTTLTCMYTTTCTCTGKCFSQMYMYIKPTHNTYNKQLQILLLSEVTKYM